MADTYYKSEWFDESPIGIGDIIQLPSMSFGLVTAVFKEETEDMAGNVISVDDEYLAVCLYSSNVSTVSSRQNPQKFKKEYLNDILTTAPYHRWIFENYDEFYSEDPEWMEWFVNDASKFDMTFRSYIAKADEMLALQGAVWEPERPSEEWIAQFWERVNSRG